MKTECEIRVMLANLEAEKKNFQCQCIERGISTIESAICVASFDVRIRLLKEILETEENICYG